MSGETPTRAQIGALVDEYARNLVAGGFTLGAAAIRAKLDAALAALTAEPEASARDAETARLLRIADDIDAYGRDEGGFSNETRAAIHDDAAFLRKFAARATRSTGYTSTAPEPSA